MGPDPLTPPRRAARLAVHESAADSQCGAVEERAQQVHPDYVRHARQLDRRYHGPGTITHRYPVGPVEQVLLDHVWTRGLVFGEWGWDVEWQIVRRAYVADSEVAQHVNWKGLAAADLR